MSELGDMAGISASEMMVNFGNDVPGTESAGSLEEELSAACAHCVASHSQAGTLNVAAATAELNLLKDAVQGVPGMGDAVDAVIDALSELHESGAIEAAVSERFSSALAGAQAVDAASGVSVHLSVDAASSDASKTSGLG